MYIKTPSCINFEEEKQHYFRYNKIINMKRILKRKECTETNILIFDKSINILSFATTCHCKIMILKYYCYPALNILL